MKNGWHTISGYEVYIENDRVVRGLNEDEMRTIYPYRVSRKYGCVNDAGLTVNAFRAGVKRGTVEMR